MRTDNNFNLIRLLAACQVLIVHALNHLDYKGALVDIVKLVPGVPVFFFVSGMLITSSYERLSLRQSGLREFIFNRLLRIYPALWLCVLLSVLAVWLTGYFETQSIHLSNLLLWLAGQLSFVQFYNPDFMRGFGVGVLNGALWTIAVELQFYALTPILFWLVVRRQSWFLIILLTSMVINVWFRLSYDWSDIRINLLSVTFMPWVYMFMIGVLAKMYQQRLSVWFSNMGNWGGVLLIVAYLASMVFIGSLSDNSNNSIHPIAFILLCALVFKFSTAKLPFSKWFTETIQRNDYSYGIYIFHTPILNITVYIGFLHANPNWQLGWVLLTPFLLAMLSWHIVEKRVLALKSRL